jgi:hypothetical protein
MTASSADPTGSGLTFKFGTLMNSFGIQLGDWGTCCYNSSLYIQFGNQASNSWENAQLIGTHTKIADVPEQANGKTYTFIGAINDTNFFDMVRIYGDGNGDVLYAGGTIYTGSVTLNSVPSSAGSSTQTSSSDIDKTQPQYLASNLGSSVNPAFVGGTLKSDVASVTQNFTIDDSANGASSTIDQNGMDSNYSGVLSDAAGKTVPLPLVIVARAAVSPSRAAILIPAAPPSIAMPRWHCPVMAAFPPPVPSLIMAIWIFQPPIAVPASTACPVTAAWHLAARRLP